MSTTMYEKLSPIFSAYADKINQNASDITDVNTSLSVATTWVDVAVDGANRRYISIEDKEETTSSGTALFTSEVLSVKPGQIYKVTGSAYSGGHAEYALLSGSTIVTVYPSSAVSGAHTSTQIVVIPEGIDGLQVSRYKTAQTDWDVKRLYDNADLETMIAHNFDSEDFEVGGISPSTGENVTVDSRCRSKTYISSDIARVASATYGITIYVYDSNDGFVGFLQGESIVTITRQPSPQFRTKTFDLRQFASGYKYRISIDKGSSVSKDVAVPTVQYDVKIEDECEDIRTEIESVADDIQPEIYFSAKDDIARLTTSAEVWALYDALATAYPDYVTKNTLTQDTFTNYEYVFDSHAYNYQSASRAKFESESKPLILITSGVHGNEPSAVMSTYVFFKALCEDVPAVRKIRQSFVFRLIPIVVPYSFDNNVRWNENGVNINRNFDADWSAPGETEPFTNNYPGTSAASEPETQVAQAWLQAHTDAAFYIDFHNSGYTSEVSYLSLLSTLTGFADIQKGYRCAHNELIGHWRSDRDMTADTLIYAYTGHISVNGNSEGYGDSISIPSMTLETSENQAASGKNSNFTIGVGAESLAALIRGLMEYHFNL